MKHSNNVKECDNKYLISNKYFFSAQALAWFKTWNFSI